MSFLPWLTPVFIWPLLTEWHIADTEVRQLLPSQQSQEPRNQGHSRQDISKPVNKEQTCQKTKISFVKTIVYSLKYPSLLGNFLISFGFIFISFVYIFISDFIQLQIHLFCQKQKQKKKSPMQSMLTEQLNNSSFGFYSCKDTMPTAMLTVNHIKDEICCGRWISCRPRGLTLYLWDVGCQKLAAFLLIALLSDVSCTDRDRQITRNRQTEREEGEQRDESLAQPCPGGGARLCPCACVLVGMWVCVCMRVHTNALRITVSGRLRWHHRAPEETCTSKWPALTPGMSVIYAQEVVCDSCK